MEKKMATLMVAVLFLIAVPFTFIQVPDFESLKPLADILNYLRRVFGDIWLPVKSFFIREYEERKIIIQQEIEKEKQEFKESVQSEILKRSKFLWEKIKGLVR